MLLSKRSRKCLFLMIRLACFIRLAPFHWNNKKSCLETASGFHLFLYHLQKLYTFGLVLFSSTRLARNYIFGELPVFQLLVAIAWTNGYLITAIAFTQLDHLRVDMKCTGNRLLLYLQDDDEVEPKMLDGPTKESNKGANNTGRNQLAYKKRFKRGKARKDYQVSYQVYTALALMVINPFAHNLITYQSPCAPNFFSSAYFECKRVDENVIPLMKLMPFLIVEFYNVNLFVVINSFTWSFILIGLARVSFELHNLAEIKKFSKENCARLYNGFRKCELLTTSINYSYRYYLMTFPSILFLIVSILLFGTIRLWHLDPRSYVMFPFCAMRCAFEATTPLTMAAIVHKTSQRVMNRWKEVLDLNDFTIRKKLVEGGRIIHLEVNSERRVLQTLQRALRTIKCTAGSLYTFEHSIVLTSLDNCLSLTFNLLVTFKDQI